MKRLLALLSVPLLSCEGWLEPGDAGADAAREPDPEDAGRFVEDAGVIAVPDAGLIDAGLIDAGGMDAGGMDAGGMDAGGIDAGVREPPDAGQPARVSVLIAQGRFGRTVISCDDGRHWVNDRDESNGLVCGEAPNVDCWHHPTAPMGMVQAGAAVVATWGWGPVPGRVRRTLDGVTWQDVIPSSTFAGIAAGNGRVVLAGGPARISTDDGATWVNGGSPNTLGGVLRLADWAGRFLLTQDERVHVSDDGTTWRSPTSPMGCAGPALGIVTHAGTALIVQYGGRVCVTTDAGDTWQLVNVAPAFTTRGVWANGAFHLWNNATRYRSVDGLTWTSASGSPGDAQIGAVAFTAAGTFVAFKGGWQSEYQHERVYRSTDGLSWSQVPEVDHPHSHPITRVVAAEVQASAVCP